MMSKKITKKKSSINVVQRTSIIVATTILAVVTGYVLHAALNPPVTTKNGTPISQSDLSLMESHKPFISLVDSVSGKKIDTPNSLIEALANEYPQRPCAEYTQGMFKVSILSVAKDDKQALVGLGCGSSGMQRAIFVLQADDTWLKLGALDFVYTNQDTTTTFSSTLDVPSCETINKYSLAQTVAPVCYNGSADTPSSYTVR